VYDLSAAAQGVAVGFFKGHQAAPDLVTANANGSLSVLLGNGDGTFLNPETITLGGSATGVAVGDLRGIGRQDIVAANNNGTVSVVLSNGNNTFQGPVALTVGATPVAVAVADLNGDGRPDIVTANSNGSVTVLAGNGDGTFQNPLTSQAYGTLTSVAVGDLSGDGKPDLVVGTLTGLDVLQGNGDGTFFVKQIVPFYTIASTIQFPVEVKAVALSDLNRDGKLDIVANDGGVSVLLGNGDGTVQNPVNQSVGGYGVDSLGVGDFNGDGKPDIVTSNSGSSFGAGPSVSVLSGNGDGTFKPAQSTFIGVAGAALAVADLQGDGKLDIALASAYGSNSVTPLLGNGNGTFVTTPTVAANILPDQLATADFNGDGKLDIAATGSAGTVILLNNGDGSFRNGPTLKFNNIATAMVTGDFNGDGKPDLALAAQYGTVDVFLGNGDGSFKNAQAVSVGSNDTIEALATGDLNGDNRLDLAVAFTSRSGHQSGQVTVLLGNGNGSFQKTSNTSVGTDAYGVAVADLNGDGHLDVVTTTILPGGNHDVKVLLGNGDGTLKSPTSIRPGGRAESVTTGDFTGDGKQDLLLVDRFNNTVRVLPGNGDGTFGHAITFQFNNPVVGLGGPAVGDFFGDGRLSVAVTTGLGTVSVLSADGDGTFQANVDYVVNEHGQEPATVIAGDFNGDGKLDLVATNFLSDDLSVLLNTSPPFTVMSPVATRTTLTTNASPAVFDQQVTLTATVISVNGTPTGTVTFSDGGTVLAEVAVDPNGQAALTTPLAKVGVHSLKASFAGTGAFSGSTGRFSETVNQAATTTTVSDLIFGSEVILSAAVAPVSPGGGVPTGTVTFFDGNTLLGTATIFAGSASLNVNLAAGTHTLTGSYSGDTNFLASVSAPFIITISAPTGAELSQALLVHNATPAPGLFALLDTGSDDLTATQHRLIQSLIAEEESANAPDPLGV
jgi:hypothetical protein